MLQVWQLSHMFDLFLLSSHLALHDMWLQSFVEVGHAKRSINNCEYNQDDGNHRETGKHLPNRDVIRFMTRLIHPGELKNKVSQSANVTEYCNDHSESVLPTSPESCHNKNEDRDRNGSYSNPFFCICKSGDNHKELDCEGQEEEEVELQQSNVDLECISKYRTQKTVALPEMSRTCASSAGRH
jgi:hypothetical protein